MMEAKSRAAHFEIKSNKLELENEEKDKQISLLRSDYNKTFRQLEKLENEKRDKADKARAMKLVKSVYI